MSNSDANIRINNLWERLCLGMLSLIVSALFLTYQYQRTDFKTLEEKVLVMQMNKVNKEDLKDVESRLNLKMDAMAINMSQEVRNTRSDIIDRIELLFGKVKK